MSRLINVGPADLASGERRLVDVEGRSIGIFNVNGEYYALHNRCPHMGGALCAGPVTGTTVAGDRYVDAENGRLYGGLCARR